MRGWTVYKAPVTNRIWFFHRGAQRNESANGDPDEWFYADASEDFGWIPASSDRGYMFYHGATGRFFFPYEVVCMHIMPALADAEGIGAGTAPVDRSGRLSLQAQGAGILPVDGDLVRDMLAEMRLRCLQQTPRGRTATGEHGMNAGIYDYCSNMYGHSGLAADGIAGSPAPARNSHGNLRMLNDDFAALNPGRAGRSSAEAQGVDPTPVDSDLVKDVLAEMRLRSRQQNPHGRTSTGEHGMNPGIYRRCLNRFGHHGLAADGTPITPMPTRNPDELLLIMNDEIADLNLEFQVQTSQDIPDDARSSSMLLFDEMADQTIARRGCTTPSCRDEHLPVVPAPRTPLTSLQICLRSRAKARPPATQPKHMPECVLPRPIRPEPVQPAPPPPFSTGLAPPPAQRRRLWHD